MGRVSFYCSTVEALAQLNGTVRVLSSDLSRMHIHFEFKVLSISCSSEQGATYKHGRNHILLLRLK